MAEPNLAQRLGYPADAKLVIINADDLGSCHSANVGVFECLNTGTVTSATLMVPCPWAREASSRYRGEDVGVHLTLNAEYELYQWGPITHAPSLLGGDGGFPRTVEDVWDHADLDEVRRECRAQIERAVRARPSSRTSPRCARASPSSCCTPRWTAPKCGRSPRTTGRSASTTTK